jgi:hypothetical protein
VRSPDVAAPESDMHGGEQMGARGGGEDEGVIRVRVHVRVYACVCVCAGSESRNDNNNSRKQTCGTGRKSCLQASDETDETACSHLGEDSSSTIVPLAAMNSAVTLYEPSILLGDRSN